LTPDWNFRTACGNAKFFSNAEAGGVGIVKFSAIGDGVKKMLIWYFFVVSHLLMKFSR
jgi:hypothetical protein